MEDFERRSFVGGFFRIWRFCFAGRSAGCTRTRSANQHAIRRNRCGSIFHVHSKSSVDTSWAGEQFGRCRFSAECSYNCAANFYREWNKAVARFHLWPRNLGVCFAYRARFPDHNADRITKYISQPDSGFQRNSQRIQWLQRTSYFDLRRGQHFSTSCELVFSRYAVCSFGFRYCIHAHNNGGYRRLFLPGTWIGE